MDNNISKLAKYGVVGICIALIIAVVYIVNLFAGLIQDSNQQFVSLIQESNKEIIKSIDKNTEAMQNVAEEYGNMKSILAELAYFLRQHNGSK